MTERTKAKSERMKTHPIIAALLLLQVPLLARGADLAARCTGRVFCIDLTAGRALLTRLPGRYPNHRFGAAIA